MVEGVSSSQVCDHEFVHTDAVAADGGEGDDEMDLDDGGGSSDGAVIGALTEGVVHAFHTSAVVWLAPSPTVSLQLGVYPTPAEKAAVVCIVACVVHVVDVVDVAGI